MDARDGVLLRGQTAERIFWMKVTEGLRNWSLRVDSPSPVELQVGSDNQVLYSCTDRSCQFRWKQSSGNDGSIIKLSIVNTEDANLEFEGFSAFLAAFREQLFDVQYASP